ncbi:hypothetical protein ACFWVP_24555 [Streptomyces sp. NPDC058637]|uniref:hypothetical protein n=1 Tax=Streptomyces sp. NPDC058637 TaxID=3346569 RepID=UPI00364CE29F
MSEQIDAAGQRVFEMFGAVAGAPDDVAAGQEADAALAALEALLVEAGGPAGDR